MKKVIPISLLVILSLNSIGYKFIASYFERKASTELQVLLDQNKYKDSDLISFKLPLHLPYIIDSKEFEAAQGNIDINGISYQYVKKRVYNDTLEILCIPNYTITSIKNSKDNFAKQLNAIATNDYAKKSSNKPLLKISSSDYTQAHHFNIYTFISPSKLKHDSYYCLLSSFDYLRGLDQPPEA